MFLPAGRQAVLHIFVKDSLLFDPFGVAFLFFFLRRTASAVIYIEPLSGFSSQVTYLVLTGVLNLPTMKYLHCEYIHHYPGGRLAIKEVALALKFPKAHSRHRLLHVRLISTIQIGTTPKGLNVNVRR
jgi:hypothetical protein